MGIMIVEDQSGFTPGHTCVDTLQQLCDKTVGKYIHIAFMNIQKAYDSVPRRKLWEVLQRGNLHLIRITQELYDQIIAIVKQNNDVSDLTGTTKGLCQNSSLSLILFKIYVEFTLNNWKCSCKGMMVLIGDYHLFTFSFADQVV